MLLHAARPSPLQAASYGIMMRGKPQPVHRLLSGLGEMALARKLDLQRRGSSAQARLITSIRPILAHRLDRAFRMRGLIIVSAALQNLRTQMQL